MVGMSFGQAMDKRVRLADDRHRQDWQKINDEYDINSQNAMSNRIGALKDAGGGGGKPQGLAAAKTPTFSNLGTMTGASGASDRPAGQFETPRSIAAGMESQSPADKYTANPYDPVGRGAYPDLDPQGSRGKTLYAENAAGQVFSGMSPQYQSGVTDTTQAVKDDGLGVGGLKEGGIIERVGNMLGLRKPSEAPQQSANRVADTFGGLSGEAARTLRARPRQIEEELKRQGLRKGKTRVTDPDGSPVEDTVDAKLADGEAVLNAGAAEMLGRDEIERLNAAGAEKLGLRNGGAQMKNGVMHAAGGGLVDPANLTGAGSVIEQRRADLRAFYENEKRAADAERAFRQAGQIESPRNVPVQDGLRTPRMGPGAGFTMRPNPNSLPVPRGGGPVVPFEPAIIPESAPQRFGQLARAAQQAPVDAEIIQSRSLVPTGQGETWNSERFGARDTVKGSTPKGSIKVPTNTPPELSLRGVGRALGGAANIGGYMAMPEEEKVAAMPGFGPMGAVVGLAGRALQPLRDKLYAPAYAKGEELMGGLKERVGNVMPQGPSQQMSPGDARLAMRSAEPQYTQQVPVPAGYVQPSPARDAAQAVGNADEAAFSKFFNEQGITDKMRKSGKGLRQINAPGSTDQIYRTKSGEYVVMGAPSRIAAEKAKAEDPVLKRAAAMEEMRQYALQGNENAVKMYNQMLEQDSAREVMGMRTKADIEAAGLKGSGKAGKDNSLGFNEMLKAGTTLMGKGREAEFLAAVNQSKQADIMKMRKAAAATEDPAKRQQLLDAADAAGGTDPDWDYMQEVAKRMKLRDVGVSESQTNRALNLGAWGAPVGAAAAGLGTLALTRKPKLALKAAGLGAALGAPAGAVYGYKTGVEGVDEATDLSRFSNDRTGVQSNKGDLVGDGITYPGSVIPEDLKVLYGLRR